MAKKDFGRRLMPEYLLKYSEELQKNHPDPSASWGGGGGGGDYTAGEGIDITGDVISIDEEVVAKKTDIPDVSDFVTDTDLNTALADYELKSEAFSGSYNDLTDKPTLATVATTGDYDDLLNKPTIPVVPSVLSAFTNDVGYITGITSADVVTALGYTPGTSNFSGSYTDLTNKPTIPTKTSDLQNDSGFITGVTWNDVTGKPTFATVATSGSYNDLSDKPTIPDTSNLVTTNTTQTIIGTKTFSNGISETDNLNSGSGDTHMFTATIYADEIHIGHLIGGTDIHLLYPEKANGSYTLATTDDIPSLSGYATETWVGQQGYLTNVTWDIITGKPTFATVATSGSYNDLSDKPTIPTVPSVLSAFTNDVGYITGITSSDVTTALGYTPGTSNFSGSYTDLTDKPTIPTVNDATITFTQGGTTKGTITLNQSTNQTIALDAGGGSVAWDDITNKPTFATVATSGSYADLSNKPSIPSTASSTSTSTVTPTTETLVFTLDDDSTVTVNVMTGATVSTTTTTTLS